MGTVTTGAPAPLPALDEDSGRRSGPLLEGLREAGACVRFIGQALVALPRSIRYFSEILRQAAMMAPSTITLLAFMQVMIGITAANFVYFLLKALGATDFTGIGGTLTIRVACAVMFGYVFVSKVCGGLVAELGAMTIGQEITAIESTGVDPMAYVVGTRILATILLIPVMTAISLIAFYAGYYFTVVIVLQGVDGHSLNQFYWGTQSIRDEIYLLAVVTSTTVITGVVACFYGLRARGGPAGVGAAVSRAVLVNILIVHVVGMVLVILWYGNSFGLPIGG
jgi:phospholipid/cholesterol/gamma-HCH transport system permease protein